MFDNFVQTDADKSRDVRNALNSSRQKAVEQKRNRLSHIIRTIEFCGRQEIPLRGHRDAGAFSLNETDCNDGVFKAASRLRVEAADKQTSDLFKGSLQRFIFKLDSAKSNYIFDGWCHTKANTFRYFPMQILFHTSWWNDWCRLSQTEQLSLSVRFIKDTKVHEEFLCFVPVSSTTGKDLASTILTQLSQLGLNLEHMCGQGYDGASNMSGKYRGVQARVKELYPLAMHTH